MLSAMSGLSFQISMNSGRRFTISISKAVDHIGILKRRERQQCQQRQAVVLGGCQLALELAEFVERPPERSARHCHGMISSLSYQLVRMRPPKTTNASIRLRRQRRPGLPALILVDR